MACRVAAFAADKIASNMVCPDNRRPNSLPTRHIALTKGPNIAVHNDQDPYLGGAPLRLAD